MKMEKACTICAASLRHSLANSRSSKLVQRFPKHVEWLSASFVLLVCVTASPLGLALHDFTLIGAYNNLSFDLGKALRLYITLGKALRLQKHNNFKESQKMHNLESDDFMRLHLRGLYGH